jgi:acetyltransferase-like isoleucine patch superfamily enzyme
MRRKLRFAFAALFGFLPSPLARLLYRLFFGYKIGKRVKIGFSVIDVNSCEIGDDVTIGHFNLFTGTLKVTIGEKTRIGFFNIFRGGDGIAIGKYCEILRWNEINSIPEPDAVNDIDPRFILGDGSMIAASHKIDFTDKVVFGKRVILGGRNSSVWTHNRQKTEPVIVGDYAYLGSEIRMAPGSVIPAQCILAMGSVVSGELKNENRLIAGVPAKEIRELGDEGRFLVEQKTRRDLPDDI